MTVNSNWGAMFCVPMLRVGAFSLLLVLGVPAYGAADGAPDEPRISIEPRLKAPLHSDFRIDSNLVLLPVNVTDRQNRSVTGLDAGEFRVFEGATEQKVLHLSTDDAPLSVGIVFDASGSMASKLGKAREAVAEFLKGANPSDEFFLVNFSGKAELAVPFTQSHEDIQGRLIATKSEGKTALLDGVYLALIQMKKAGNARKALLVISDGGENDSRYSEGEIRKMVRESDVWIYAIGIYARAPQMLPEEERGGPKLLTDVAEQTGGRHLAVHHENELPDAAAKVGLELRNRYILAYSPANAARDGKYHRVQVKLSGRRDLHLSWRPGYFAPAR